MPKLRVLVETPPECDGSDESLQALRDYIERMREELEYLFLHPEVASEDIDYSGIGPKPSTALPEMDGEAYPGNVATFSRGNHVHPTDTSRASAEDLTDHVEDTNNPHAVTAAQTGAVPDTREINGHALSADVGLDASDVGLGNVANERQYSANNPPPAPDADDISYDNTTSGLTATDVQDAIDEVYADVGGKQASITASGILKGDGAGGVSAAVAGTDYQVPLTAGTDYATPAMIPSVPDPSDATPQALGTAAAGSSGDYSRADHVHGMPSASDVGALASDGTAVAANTLAAAHVFRGAAGWYAFFSRTLAAGGSVDITLLVEDSYNRANGILRLYSGRASGGAFTGYINWLSVVAWSPTDVRFLYDSSTAAVTLYINKLSNNNGRLVFRVLSAVNRNGADIVLTDNWLSTAVSEPTTATAATQGIKPAVGSVTLTASWSGSGPYTQTVTVTGPPVTADSKVDLLFTAAQLAELKSLGTEIIVRNNAGTLTAYAIGPVPSGAMTVDCTVEETV